MSEPAEPAERRSALERLLGARLDLTPLRASREFRLVFGSEVSAYLCFTFALVAIPYQLYTLTGSNLAVGVMGGVQLVPMIVFGLYGGALADRVDRRTMLLLAGAAETLLMAALVGNALLAQPQVWVLYVVGALNAAVGALSRPSREALVPLVVRHDDIPSAMAVSSLSYQLGMLVGPGLAGLLMAHADVALAYLVSAAGLAVSTLVLLPLRRFPPVSGGHTEGSSLGAIRAGLRYAVARKDLLGTYLVDMVGMVLAMPVVLFPALAETVFARPQLLGLLYSAEAVGSIAASLTSGWVRHVHRHGRAVTIAAICWGAAIGVAGLMPTMWLAIVMFAVAGGADMISGVFRGTIWHQTIPDELRGRLAGIELLSYNIGPLGGQLRSGLVADLTTVRVSIVSGGALCLVGVAATAAALRGFWNYDARTDEHAVRQRERRARDDGPAPA